MRLLLADDHDLVRDTLTSYLAREGDLEICAVGDLAGAIDALGHQGPFNLALLDYAMPGMNGLDGLARFLKLPDVPPVVLLSGLASGAIATEALMLGARGFLTKSMSARALVHAIRLMLEGERFLPVDIMLPLVLQAPASMSFAPMPMRADRVHLTPRELEVLGALCAGKTNKEIARDLGLREPTIKLHVKTLYRRLGATNRTQAAMIARSAGLL